MAKSKRSTKINKIRDRIATDIREGRTRVGEPIPSVSRLMKEFDCARMTVVTAIKHLQSEGLIYSINGSGTYVCPTPCRYKVVVLYPGDNKVLFNQGTIGRHQFSHGAKEAVRSHFREYAVVEESCATFLEHLPLAEIIYPGLRGVVLFRGYDYVDRIAPVLDAKGIPWIFYGSDIAPVRCRNRLLVNETKVAETAVDFLYTNGHEQIGLVYFPRHAVHRDIYERFPIALQRRRLELRAEYVVAVDDPFGKDAPERLAPLLALAERPTALFCAADSLAINVLWSLARAGVQCPEDISVLGAEDTPFAETTHPALTTLVLSLERSGASCVEQVINAWGNATRPICLESKLTLVRRDSVLDRSATPPTSRNPAAPAVTSGGRPE